MLSNKGNKPLATSSQPHALSPNMAIIRLVCDYLPLLPTSRAHQIHVPRGLSLSRNMLVEHGEGEGEGGWLVRRLGVGSGQGQ
jgi:hypothetical protein